MSLFVKICGVTSTSLAETCVRAGADAIGLVLTDSPRRVSMLHAATIADDVRGRVQVVAVFRKPSPEIVQRALDIVRPDLVQADHGHLNPARPDLQLPVFREGSSLSQASGRFLYEGAQSGIGYRVDLSAAREASQLGEMVLAGGLSPANVEESIQAIRPHGVDVSSGVESSPGIKEPDLIREFVRAARAADRVAVQ